MDKPLRLICGVDEAGRGPLAGAVFAAAVILDKKRRIPGLADSKALTPAKREALEVKIKKRSLAWSVAFAEVEEIDRLNILRASLLAMKRAVEGLRVEPTELVVDGIHCPETFIPSRALIKGDSLMAEISAASILAKTARDAYMCKLHLQYPQYGFDKHKGYATQEHLQALDQHGICEVHRMSFSPVRLAAGIEPEIPVLAEEINSELMQDSLPLF